MQVKLGVTSTAPVSITQRTVFVVEGRDDRDFLDALATSLQLPPRQFIVAEGVTQIRPVVRATALAPGFGQVTSFCVVRDADNNPVGALQSVQAALQSARLS